ncbi:MAG: alpha/beta hydrolase [Actinomycetota bacterium]
MATALINDGTIDFEERGEGPAVVLVHGSVVADPWGPMLDHGDLGTDHRVLTFRRRGFGRSSPPSPGRTLGDDAADLVALLDHLGITQANAVGHSLAADIVLQAALDAPDRFRSLALLEPGLFSVPAAQGFEQAMRPVFDLFEAGQHRQAMLAFLGGVGGAEVMARLEARLPQGTTDAALADVGTLFQHDIPAGSGWTLDEAAARDLPHPTLLALGSESGPIFRQSRDALSALLGNVSVLDVEGSAHFVHVEQPEQVAAGLAAFLRSGVEGR